jgi:hypothetical protein
MEINPPDLLGTTTREDAVMHVLMIGSGATGLESRVRVVMRAAALSPDIRGVQS